MFRGAEREKYLATWSQIPSGPNINILYNAPVVQRIGRRLPEPEIGVRILSGANEQREFAHEAKALLLLREDSKRFSMSSGARQKSSALQGRILSGANEQREFAHEAKALLLLREDSKRFSMSSGARQKSSALQGRILSGANEQREFAHEAKALLLLRLELRGKSISPRDTFSVVAACDRILSRTRIKKHSSFIPQLEKMLSYMITL